MPNRSIKDERDTSKRAGAPGRGSLFGKKEPPSKSSGSKKGDSDLSAYGAGRKLIQRKARLDRAIDEAS